MKTAREYANAIRVNYLLGQAEEDRIAADFEQAIADARRAALAICIEITETHSAVSPTRDALIQKFRALLDAEILVKGER